MPRRRDPEIMRLDAIVKWADVRLDAMLNGRRAGIGLWSAHLAGDAEAHAIKIAMAVVEPYRDLN